MSTKVYTAYKLKDSRQLWDICLDIKVKGMEEVKKVLSNLYMDMVEEVDLTSEEYQKSLSFYLKDIRARLMVVDRVVNKGYQNLANSAYRNIFDFNVSVAFHEYQGQIYFIPYSDMLVRRVLDFLKEDPRLEDFCYWDNTDRDEDVSEEEWEARGKIWNSLDGACWGRHLVLEVCTPDTYYLVSPYFDLNTKFKDESWEPKKKNQE